jgi:hypothetical protein
MVREPNSEKHLIFESYAEAMEAWSNLTPEQQEQVTSPRQAVPNLWIFDKPNEDE